LTLTLRFSIDHLTNDLTIGSGKTIAFLIPALERIARQGVQHNAISILIISPTRELAQQIADECVKLQTFHQGMSCVCVVGGTNMNTDQRALSRGATCLVGTPGRLLDLLSNHRPMQAMIAKMKILVFDEADRLLDQGEMHCN
jgi:ATP-dependent RNA helicase MSS116, mitochondrial